MVPTERALVNESILRLCRRIQNQCHRTVIRQLDLHVRTEPPFGHGNPQCPQSIGKRDDQRLGHFGSCGVDEAGPTTFLAIGIEREIGDDENASVHILHRTIHFSRIVFERPQIGDLVCEPFGIRSGIAHGDADKSQPTSLNLADRFARNFYAGTGCPLEDDSHNRTVFRLGTTVMAMENFSRHQQGIIKRYYEHKDEIALQRLAELVTDLYLAEGKKRATVWKNLVIILEKLKVPKDRIDHFMKADDPKLLANLVTELQGKV